MIHLFSHTFNVFRAGRVSDGQGGWTEGFVPVGTVRGRLRPATARERLVAQQLQAELSHVFYAGAAADVRRGDRVEGAGKAVLVVAVRDPSHAGHHIEADCQEVQTGG